jgi:hypothetical protein
MKLTWIAIPVVIMVVLLIFVFFPKKNKDIPENIIGKWTTSAPRYEDRFIEITKDTVVYGLGGDKKDVYFISNLETNPEGNKLLYTISFKNTEGLAFTRSFYYHPENGGAIQFKHQEHITWRKTKDTVVEENSEPDQNMKAGQNATNR